MCLHTGICACPHLRKHAFSAVFTWHAICTGVWCVGCCRSTSKPNHVTFCTCAKINTTPKTSRNPCLYLCQKKNNGKNKWQNTFINTFHLISVLNLTPSAYTKAKFWSHTHIILIFWRSHTVKPHYCTLAIKSEVSSGFCHLIAPWLAFGKRPSEGFICWKILQKKKNMSEEIWVWGCFVSPGFEQVE